MTWNFYYIQIFLMILMVILYYVVNTDIKYWEII